MLLGSALLMGSVALAAAPAAPHQAAAAAEYFPLTSTGATPLPFSEAVKVGNTLYLSGLIGTLPGTLTLAPGGITAEARQALENIEAVLERHNSSMDQVVKCTVFIADMKDWPAFNEVYRQFFKSHFPARSAFGVSGLAFNARVEVECIAVTAQ